MTCTRATLYVCAFSSPLPHTCTIPASGVHDTDAARIAGIVASYTHSRPPQRPVIGYVHVYARRVYVYRQTTRADAVEIRQSDLNTSGDTPTLISIGFFQNVFFFFSSPSFYLPSFHREIEVLKEEFGRKIERIWRDFFGEGSGGEFSSFVGNSIWIFEYWWRGGEVFIGPGSRSLDLVRENLIWKGLGITLYNFERFEVIDEVNGLFDAVEKVRWEKYIEICDRIKEGDPSISSTFLSTIYLRVCVISFHG